MVRDNFDPNDPEQHVDQHKQISNCQTADKVVGSIFQLVMFGDQVDDYEIPREADGKQDGRRNVQGDVHPGYVVLRDCSIVHDSSQDSPIIYKYLRSQHRSSLDRN